jgi:PAS domain S-box-containing protein
MDQSPTKKDTPREIVVDRSGKNKPPSQEARTQNSLFKGAPVGIFQATPQGRYHMVNPAFAAIFGFSSPEQMLREVKGIDEHCMDPVQWDGVKRLLQERGELRGHEIHLSGRDGSKMWISISVTPMEDASGEIYYTGFTTDITEHKLAQEALRQSEKELRTLFERLPVGLYRTDLEGRIVEANPALIAMLGYPNRESLLKSSSTRFFVRPEDQQEQRRILEQQGMLRGFEVELRRRDGSTVWVRDSARAVRSPDGRILYEGSLENITEQKQAEEERNQLEAQFRQAQKMEAVGRLAGGVAHDFNNMLSVILGYIDMALMEADSSLPLKKDLLEIQKAATRSAELTRQLLTFSRKQIVEPEVVNLNTAVGRQKEMLERLIGENIQITFLPAGNIWNIRIDPSQIDQILANLAVNARDAISGNGTITIQTGNVTIEHRDDRTPFDADPGDYVRLAFIDTGVGMDAETLELVFEPFFTTKEKEKGTGLGLATVYGIVRQNNGFISAHSEPGKGTTFELLFPRFEGTTGKPGKNLEQPVSRGTETVLIAEDERQILLLAKEMLERHGYQVLAGCGPEEALQLAESHPDGIHLLLTDVVMPSMDGKELESHVTRIHPSIKTLYMSGYTANVIAEYGVVEQGIHFIQKPFTVQELASKVREVLDS